MKKSILISAFVCLFLGTFGTLSAAPKKPLVLEPIEIDPIIQSNNDIEVIADPRLEIIGIICRLAGYDGFTNYYTGEATYTTQIDSFFAKYKEEKVVTTAKAFKDRGITAHSMISLAYHIKPDFSGTVIDFDPYPVTLMDNWKKIRTKEIYNFIKDVHDFLIKTNYSRLRILNKPTLLSNVGYFLRDFEDFAIPQFTDDFFGKNVFDKKVISVNMICPLLFAYDIVTDRDGKTTSYTTVYSGCYISNMTITYFTNYLQEYADTNWEAVKDNFTNLILYYSKKMYPDKYKEYEKQLKESINSSLFAQYFCDFVYLEYLRSPIYENAKKKEGALTYEYYYGELEKTYSSEWFYQLNNLTAEYVNNRDKYSSLKVFFPKIVDVINSINIDEE
ncbi:MAG: DUF4932 domain-containing protein [Treponema sp.]|nr:DUF4932 domain-containing protein [Treponema sp.]